jgi:hypothetical protein
MSSQNPLLVRDDQTCNQAMMGDRRDATARPRAARRRLPSYCPESGHMIIWRDEAQPCKSRFGHLRL